MPTIRGEATTVPIDHRRAVLGLSATALGSYRDDLDYELLSARVASAGADLSRLSFMRRTGVLTHPHQAGVFATNDPADRLLGDWVRLRFSGPTGMTAEEFVGIVIHENRELFSTDQGLTGRQRFTAVGPLHLLDQIHVTEAFWLEDGGVISSRRIPSFNARDRLGMLVGNRSASVEGVSYVFGGTDTWTRRQTVDYLLARFTAATGYTWTVSGDTALIDVATDTISMGQSGSVANVIRRILHPQFGMDFKICRTSQGFELRVFSLASQEVTYLGTTIPKNPRRTRVEIGEAPDLLGVRFNRSYDQRYSKVRLRGGPIVTAITLRAASGHLIPKWSAGLEAEYLAGSGTPADAPEVHDNARNRPKLSTVFAVFGAPNPFALALVAAGLEIDESAQIVAVDASHPSSNRITLPWVPLRAGYDYETGEELDNTLAGHEADFQRPSVWLLDSRLGRYVPAEAVGFSVAASRNDWGVVLSGDVAHRLAVGRFAGAAGTETAPEYDLNEIIATVGIPSDVRLVMEAVHEDGEDNGTILDVEMEAELWVAAPGTITGLSAGGAPVALAQSLTLRDDRPRMAAVMAALIARYLHPRARAEVKLQGYQPWASEIGSILTTIEIQGADEDIGSPITSVDYEGGQAPSTTIRAEYER